MRRRSCDPGSIPAFATRGGMPACAARRNPLYTTHVRGQKCTLQKQVHGSWHMATKQKQGAALGRKGTTAATNETDVAEKTAKTATTAATNEAEGAEKTAKTA